MSSENGCTEDARLPDVDFVKLQFEQSMEMYHKQFSLFVQIGIVLVVGNITIIGYAFSTRSAGVLLVGVLFPILVFWLMQRFERMMLPVLFTAVSLEYRYGRSNADWLASTFLSAAVSPEALNAIQSISTEQDYTKRIERLRKVNISPMGKGKGLSRAGLLLVALGQVVAPIILALVFQWQLF